MAKEKKSEDTTDKRPIIIIKRVKKNYGGAHGGSWKVAYADFVTSMMAFFLLLWLLSVTTTVQKKKIADYFAPSDTIIAKEEEGSPGVLYGLTIAKEGKLADTRPPQPTEASDAEIEARNAQKMEDAELDKQDEKAFKATEENIRQAIETIPELKELSQHLIIDMTPEGLRIQVVDQEGKPMFELGKADPLPQTVKLLTMITQVIKELPNKISLRGHTDSKPYGKEATYTNWELSADRANAARRVLVSASLPITRFENVQGKADIDPLVKDDPAAAKNRRITIILLKQSLVAAAKRTEDAFKNRKPGSEPKKREEGVIYFP